MDKNIKVHIKDRVAVAEGDPVIICGNNDYTVTFIFDEEWGEAKVKTARFKFNAGEGPEHFDQPFEGDTVKVPELSNIREVEVGVFVGDLNTTTGAPIRCKPCIRCGSGAPKDPTPDVYDTIMKLLTDGKVIEGRIVCAVNNFPEKPTDGEVVILTEPTALPWDKVKVWSREEAPYQEGGVPAICADLPPVGMFKVGEIPETLDLSVFDNSQPFACGLGVYGSTGAFQLNIGNIFGDTGAIKCIFQTPDSTYLYDQASEQTQEEGWYEMNKEGYLTKISAQDVKIPDISDAVFFDMACTISDEEYEQFKEIKLSPNLALSVIGSMTSVLTSTGIYRAEEGEGGIEWKQILGDQQAELLKISSEIKKAEDDAALAISQAKSAMTKASDAQNWALAAQDTAKKATDSANGALGVANTAVHNAASAYELVIEVREKARDNEEALNSLSEAFNGLTEAVGSLEQSVNGYSAFLDELNGEVV